MVQNVKYAPARINGMTLVELLVVIFIIGVLVAILLPAIQSAREAARKVQCKNNLRQLALAAITHEERIGHFPTGGWAGFFVGDKDRGFGQDQPGGWAYNLLPFLEETMLYDLPADGIRDVITEQQREGATRLIEHAVEVLYCPSRRPAVAVPLNDVHKNDSAYNSNTPRVTGRKDFAINVGNQFVAGRSPSMAPPPGGYPAFDWCFSTIGEAEYPWPDGCVRIYLRGGGVAEEFGFSGISFVRSEVAQRHVTDGTSNTYLIGEVSWYISPGSDGSLAPSEEIWGLGYSYSGYASGQDVPRQDGARAQVNCFGSAHPSACHMAYCDGSVRVVGYDIDLRVHQAASNRKDATALGN